MSTATAPRLAKSGTLQRPSLNEITGKGNNLPNRYVLHAVEGWGKTSWGAQTPKPVFIETKGETGLETLIDSGRLPEIPHFPECQNWDGLLGAIETLTLDPHDYKSFVVDTINGAERLCHEHVCARDFGGDWGERGFMGYMRGFEVSLGEWRLFLNALDRLRLERRMAIVCLCHTRVKPFRNPEGADYDRYSPDVHDKTWSLTHKWADAVLFGNFDITVLGDKNKEAALSKKGKATGGKFRIMYTERSPAYDAKNRLGLPPEIEMGASPQEAWDNYIAAVKGGKAAA